MPLYTFRCEDCGAELERHYTGGTAPLTFTGEEHEAPESRTLCVGRMKRVWGNTTYNFGYRPAVHSKTEQWNFTNG